jgi:D-arabinose 1-dehydrogenase-like Zn-dependent alcohol dehydrogenase
MKALAFDEFHGPLTVRELPDPVPPADAVVIRVTAAGLCRSDWHGWSGHDADIVAFPHVPGHEFAGVIESVGEAVTKWLPGVRVTTPFVCGCGQCPVCLEGLPQVCPNQTQPGFTHLGAFAERVVVRHADHNLVALPQDVPDAVAAALGCRVATSYAGVVTRGRVTANEWVVVFGCGGVGLAAVAIAAACEARVIAVDIRPESLALAREVGAIHTLDAAASDLVGAVVALTDGGAHCTIDAIGDPAVVANAISALRPRGRHVQIGLLPSATGLTPAPLARMIGRELDFIGTHGLAATDYPGLLELVRSGRLDVERFITGEVDLEQAGVRLAAMGEAPPVGVVIVRP